MAGEEVADKGSAALQAVLPSLHRTAEDDRPVVVMTCGIAGSGKSTLAKSITRNLSNFTRLSGDNIVYETHGLFAIDFPKEKYAGYLEEAQAEIKKRLVRILEETKQDIVLDLSFYDKEYRSEYKEIIDNHGGRQVLVYLDASKEVLQQRIAKRRADRDALALDDERRDGDSAFNVEDETFEMYWNGFEPPVGEGEIVVKVV